MSTQQDRYQKLVNLLLPSEIFDYFEITNMVVEDRSVSVFLDKLDIKPVVYLGQKLTSKGFHPESVVQDFPIRSKAFFLHVRRWRWLVEPTNEVVSRDWGSVAEGTRYTKGFAAFFKGIFGQLPHKQQ